MAWWVRPGVRVQFLLSVEYLLQYFQQLVYKCSTNFRFFSFCFFSTFYFACNYASCTNCDDGAAGVSLDSDATTAFPASWTGMQGG